MYKHYFFDFDGTLADTLEGISLALNKVSKESGVGNYPYSREDVKGMIGNGAFSLMLKAFKMNENDSNSTTLFDEFLKYYQEYQLKAVYLYKSVISTLKQLSESGANLYIYSNKPDKILESCVNKLLSEINFEFVIGSTKEFRPKPNPIYLESYFKEHGINKDETVYVGDSIVDLDFSKNIGIDSVIMTYGYGNYAEIADKNPTFLINDFNKVLSIGEKNGN